MKRPVALLQLIAALALPLALPAPPAFGEAAGAITTLERRIQASEPPPGAEISQSVLDFAPGAWTPVHSHGGGSYNTVLAGEITLRVGGVERTFTAGEGWADEPCVPHAAGNKSTASARLVATFAVARDVPPSLILEPHNRRGAPPEPVLVAAHKMSATDLAGPVDVVHRLISLEQGATVPMDHQPGPSFVSVLQGSVSVDLDGTTHHVKAGRGWDELTAATHTYTAAGATARVVTTTFVRRGAVASDAGEG
jgi:quercetin dioxygenase-like cupin family protein